jgi:three-Cys-motif partner protein
MQGGTSEVGPWARQKLDALGKYLHAYTTILRKQTWLDGYVYVDAFAGPGSHVIRKNSQESDVQLSMLTDYQAEFDEHREFLNGSPRVALNIQHPFTHYVFVEQDPQRSGLLQRLQEEYEGRSILIREKDCNEYLRDQLIRNHRLDWSRWRAVVLLDPFGMQVPWQTIEGLAGLRTVEVIINFPVGMAIQRLLPRSAEIPPKLRAKLDNYFGTPDWFDIVYRARDGLFGMDYDKIAESGHALARWYRTTRLGSVFTYVSSARLIRNTHGAHLYYLIHAGQNKTGAKIAEDILAKGEAIS